MSPPGSTTRSAIARRRPRRRGGQVEVTSYSNDDNDRLLTEARTLDGAQASSTTYSYDDNGNTTQKIVSANGRTDTHTYGWNDDNRLVSYKLNGQQKASYQYEPDGIRTQKNGTKYLVDYNQAYAQVLEENDDPSGNPEVVYLHGDDLLSQDRVGEESYYHADGLGSTRLLTGDDAALTDGYEYGAYGEVVLGQGSTENDFLFAGEQFDPALEMYYLRARWLVDDTGRFLSRDSWQGNVERPLTLNHCIYADSDAVNNTDPTGNETLVGLSAGQSGYSNLQKANASLNFQRAANGIRSICRHLSNLGRINRHHFLPKFAGGKNAGTVQIPEAVHHLLHRMMEAAFILSDLPHPNKGQKFFRSYMTNSQNRKEVYKAILLVSKYVDSVCAGAPRYNPIEPVLAPILK